MSIRQALNSHPVAATIGVAAAVLALGYITYNAARGTPVSSVSSGIYFTLDDGGTWTAGPPKDLIKPEAGPRLHVFRCNKDGKEFAGYMERLRPNTIKVADSPPPEAFFRSLPRTLVEVKAPGGKAWAPGTSPAADAVRSVSCPSGDGNNVTEVQP